MIYRVDEVGESRVFWTYEILYDAVSDLLTTSWDKFNTHVILDAVDGNNVNELARLDIQDDGDASLTWSTHKLDLFAKEIPS